MDRFRTRPSWRLRAAACGGALALACLGAALAPMPAQADPDDSTPTASQDAPPLVSAERSAEQVLECRVPDAPGDAPALRHVVVPLPAPSDAADEIVVLGNRGSNL